MRIGLLALLAGTVVLLGGDRRRRRGGGRLRADAAVGLGIGALASQLGAVTVSAVPDDESPEVGGMQNTMTNLGASLGTALAGSVLIAALTRAFLTNIQQSSAIPRRVKQQAQVELAAACRSSPTPTSRRRSTRPHVSGGEPMPRSSAYEDARIAGSARARDARPARDRRALLTQRMPRTQPRSDRDRWRGNDAISQACVRCHRRSYSMDWEARLEEIVLFELPRKYFAEQLLLSTLSERLAWLQIGEEASIVGVSAHAGLARFRAVASGGTGLAGEAGLLALRFEVDGRPYVLEAPQPVLAPG